MKFTDKAVRTRLMERYRGRSAPPVLGYGTVKDFCDSADHLEWMTHQGDLKDLQRPWAVKAVLACLPPGSRLIEIGAGEPLVAGVLVELGYDVTIVDPYDGTGQGPTAFDYYVKQYPHVKIVRGFLTPDLPGLTPVSYDGIYSVSVLEHVHEPALQALYAGVDRFLRVGGVSLHAIDHVLEGTAAEDHERHLAKTLGYQNLLRGETGGTESATLRALLEEVRRDLETYYLSASGHNMWRGQTPYEQFPFRKCVSIESVVTKTAGTSAKPA